MKRLQYGAANLTAGKVGCGNVRKILFDFFEKEAI